MIEDLIPFYSPRDIIIEKSEDCYQYDINNKRYIDFEAGVWCANVGHNNKRINKVIENQIKDNIHHGYIFRNRFSEELAQKLHQMFGFAGGQSVFLSSGSESINLSATISMHLTGRKKILKIDNSFLSAYGHGQISSENDRKVDIKFNDIDAIDQIDFGEIAGFILETGGASIEVVKFPDRDFVHRIIQKAKDNGVIIIVDEVTTGFGRTGKWFGFMHYDVSPDIVVTAKGLGNGYPISAVSVNHDIAERLKYKPLNYLQSHINDPLGCAVSLEVIKIIEQDNLVDECRQKGACFREKLCSLRERHPEKITDIRCRGLLIGIEFSDKLDGKHIRDGLFDRGIIVGYKLNVIRLLPPLTIKVSDIDILVGSLDSILSETPLDIL